MPIAARLLFAIVSALMLGAAVAAEPSPNTGDTPAVTRPDPCTEPKRDGKKIPDKKSAAPAAKPADSAKPR